MKRLVTPICCLVAIVGALGDLLADDRPNIVIIMVDDMGFSDIGCYGAEIETPHLDVLASNGFALHPVLQHRTLLSDASGIADWTVSASSRGRPHVRPSRPSLVSGILERPLRDHCRALRPAGYYTAVSGKWHVGSKPEHWPRQRGFDRFYGIPEGGGHHHRALPGRHLVIDDTAIEVPEGWYTTTAFTDYAIKFIDEGVKANKPVFLYLAYTAPHWPLQAPESVTEKFLGSYSEGWQPHREARFQRQVAMGMFPAARSSAPLDPENAGLVDDQRQAGNGSADGHPCRDGPLD